MTAAAAPPSATPRARFRVPASNVPPPHWAGHLPAFSDAKTGRRERLRHRSLSVRIRQEAFRPSMMIYRATQSRSKQPARGATVTPLIAAAEEDIRCIVRERLVRAALRAIIATPQEVNP